MNQKEILNKCKFIVKSIDKSRISKAITLLKSLISDINMPQYGSKIDNIEVTYNYLCEYLLNGMADAGRTEMLKDIKSRLKIIVDGIVRDIYSIDSPSYYYSTLRFNRLRNEKVSDLLAQYGTLSSELTLAEAAESNDPELRKKSEEILTRLFNTLYTSFYAESEYLDITNYIISGYADDKISVQAIGAITLGLLECYDRSKFCMLIDIFEKSDNIAVLSRVTVGILLSLQSWKSRISDDSQLCARMSLWGELDKFKLLRVAVRAIIGTRDTKLVADKMKDEVLPELMKLRPEILKHIREAGLDSISGPLDDNPEWEELLEQSGLNSQLRQLGDLQSEGADLMMITFSNLKQFPFFSSAANWFLPFDINHSQLDLDDNTRKLLSSLSELEIGVCDSDMYSLALASKMMPENQRQMMANQLGAYKDQIIQQEKSEIEDDKSSGFKNEVVKTVRDLYRFYKLFKKREGMRDPFETPLQFTTLPAIGELMRYPEMLGLVMEYYFKRGFYNDAVSLLDILTELHPDNATYWEKKGFCHQSNGNLIRALECYERASLLKQPGPWLTKKLAFVNRKLGNFEQAADYYQKALDMEPDSLSMIMNLGNVMLSLDNLPGALQNFYHANYLSPDNPKVMRALAWVELLNGNIAKSKNYYSKVISKDARNSDYLNSGHVEMLSGNFRDALNYYRLAAKDNREEFEKSFLEDLNILEKMGADKATALVVFDMV